MDLFSRLNAGLAQQTKAVSGFADFLVALAACCNAESIMEGING